MITALIVSVVPFGMPVASVFAAGPSVTGTVALDADANGVITTSLGTGAEGGLGGITVELREAGTNALIDSDVTDGTGAYTLDAPQLADPNPGDPPLSQTLYVRVVSSSGYTVSAVGDAPRVTATTGRSADFTLENDQSTTIDPIVQPDFVLSLGLLSSPDGIITGAGPFDTSDPGCAGISEPVFPDLLIDVTTSPGNDCATYDDVVRTADSVSFNYSVSGSAVDNTVGSTGDVVLEQIITPVDGAVINFTRVPARCNPTGGGGTPPPTSQIVALGGGAYKLTCNMGVINTGDVETLPTTVYIDPNSPDGSSFTSSAVLFAVNDSLVPTAVPDGPIEPPAILITSRPEWDLSKGGFYRSDIVVRNIGAGNEPGYYTYFTVRLSSDRKAGNEPLQGPLAINDNIFAFQGDGVTPFPMTLGSDYAIDDCQPFAGNIYGGFGPEVEGNLSTYYGNPASAGYIPGLAVKNSGTCSVSGTTITMTGVDYGSPYPTRTWAGADLTPGPYYVANVIVRVFLPFRTIDGTDGVIGNNAGSLVLYNKFDAFDPNGISGNSNFGAGVEPGYCPATVVGPNPASNCALMPDGSRSNDVIGPISYNISGPGISSDKYMFKPNGVDGYALLDGAVSNQDGAGLMEPGEIGISWLNIVNNGGTRLTNPNLCDVFDNTMFQLTSKTAAGLATAPGGSANSQYAYVGPLVNVLPSVDRNLWIIEYGRVSTAGDDPLSGGFDPASGRYLGTWSTQRTSNCADASSPNGWVTDPTTFPGGVDAINAVRMRSADSLNPVQFDYGNGYAHLITPLRMRNTFFGGPHDGDLIPPGAVAANYRNFYVNELYSGTWQPQMNYFPSIENTSYDGDRATVTRAKSRIKKRTITVDGIGDGAAAIDVAGNAVAGNKIVWEVLPAITSSSTSPAPVENVQIIDVLPQYADYDESCTASITGGTPADVVQYNTPSIGRTTLIWNLGTVTPNTVITPRRICTQSDTLAPSGTNLVNSSSITTPYIPTIATDLHTVSLEQTARFKLSKSVDAPLDPLNDDQVWTLGFGNFSETVNVRPVTVIEVFPYNGDGFGLGGVNRTPPSSFVGALTLTGEPVATYNNGTTLPGTMLYTADAPATINQNLNNNTNRWCSYSAGVFTGVSGTGACPASLAAVTGLKFIGSTNITNLNTPATNGGKIVFTLQAGNTSNPFATDANRPNNVYTDRFTAFSNTFVRNGLPQMLQSNTVRVRVVGFSLGDWVFNDVNGDGAYTSGVDLTAPNGVQVDLYYVPAVGAPTFVKSTTTSGGRYLFRDLADGQYFVQIPASEFAPGELLAGWSETPAPAGPADSGLRTFVYENDAVSHDGTAAGVGVVNAVRVVTGRFVTRDRSGRHVLRQRQGDDSRANTVRHGTDDASTTDPYSNLTLDLALIGPPAIRLEKDVCKNTTLGACDVDVDTNWSPTFAVVTLNETAIWRLTVTNTGLQTLNPIEIVDAAVPDCAGVLAGVSLDPGESYSFVCTGHVVTETPGAPFTNTADVIGTPVIGDDVTDTDDAQIGALPNSPGIGDFVWEDRNGNGVQDNGEPGVAGVTVELLDAGGAVVATTVTDSSGFYSIFFLDAGGPLLAATPYQVRFTPPPTYAATMTDQGGDDSLDSDGLLTPTFTLGATQYLPTLDLGLVIPARLGNYVWFDLDHNGVQDDGPSADVGVAGVVVSLTDLAGNPVVDTSGATVTSQTTDSNGFYEFTNLLPGTYRVTFDVTGVAGDPRPTTTAVAGSDPSMDSNGLTTTATLASGGNNPTLDLGLIRPAAVGNFVWEDLDFDGIQDAGEPGVAGVTVTLTDAAGNQVRDLDGVLVGTQTTPSSGAYSFGNLPPGDYVVTFSNLPAGFLETSAGQGGDPADDSNGLVTSLSLVDGQIDPTVDLGLIRPASIGDFIWRDSNFDGLQTAGEPGIEGVVVTLTNGLGDPVVDLDGNPVDPFTTGADGLYLFSNLPPGDYQLTFDPPAGYLVTRLDVGADEALDSEGLVIATTLTSGENDLTNDLGLVRAGTLGNFVWSDTDKDGVQESGELGIDGVTVTLTDESGNLVLDADGNVVAPVVTSGGGLYQFTNLPPGTYTVTFSDLPIGFQVSPSDQGGDDALDSDGTSVVVNLGDAGNDQTIDLGLVPVIYDLALAKVAVASSITFDAGPVFTVRVYNQGNYPSGQVTVLDQLPAGLAFNPAASSAGCVVVSGLLVRCTVANIVDGGFVDLTIASTVTDWSTGPWRNWAEIESDSGQSLYGVTDGDSVPEVVEANGIGSGITLPGDSYSAVSAAGATYVAPTAPDSDDNDDATVSSTALYDLALAKVAGVTTVDAPGDTVQYTITVANQGSFPSGSYTIEDVVPVGLTVDPLTISASGTYDALSRTITWNLSGLAVAASRTLTYTATITDITSGPWVNLAEITADGSALYGLTDTDSVPNDGAVGQGLDITDVANAGLLGDAGFDDEDIATVTSVATYDLALAKVANRSVAVFGDTVTYTITVANQGSLNSGAYTVVDRVPTGVTVTTPSISDGGVYDSGARTITWAVEAGDELVAGDSTTFTYDAVVSDLAGGFRNIAEITDDDSETYATTDDDSTPDNDPTNDGDYSTPGVDNTSIGDAGNGVDPQDDADAATLTNADYYDLAVAKVADVSVVTAPGNAIEYTITIANQGTLNSGTYTVVDRVPAGLTVDESSISNGGVWNSTDRTITWTRSNLAAATITTVTFTVTIADITTSPWRNFSEIGSDSAATYGGISDIDSTPGNGNPALGIDITDVADAGIGSDAGRDDEDVATVTSNAVYDLALIKVANATAVSFGDVVRYTITVANQGTLNSNAFTVVDHVPASVTVDVASITAGGIYDGTTRTITWAVAATDELDAGLSTTFEYDAEVTSLAGPFRNVAEITVDGSATYGTTDIDSNPDTNILNDGDYDDAGVDNTIIGDAGEGNDPQDDADAATVTNDDEYDLALAKTSAVVGSGDAAIVTTTIQVANQGTLPSGTYVVADVLPAGLTLVPGTIAPAGVYVAGTRTITWTLTGLDAGSVTALTYDTTVTDFALRPFRNFAQITADGAAIYGLTDRDSTPAGGVPSEGADNTGATPLTQAGIGADAGFDDQDIADIDVPFVYDLAVVKTASSPTIAANGTVVFTITVFNDGSLASGDYTIVDRVPAGMVATTASDGGDLIATPGLVTWNLTGLAAGASRELTVSMQVTDASLRPFKNIVEITADGADDYDTTNPAALVQDVEDSDSNPDADPANDNGATGTGPDGYGTFENPTNDDTVPTRGVGGEDDADVAFVDATVVYDLALVKTAPATMTPSGDITFTLQVLNQGNVPSGEFTITDTVPAGLRAVAASDGGTPVPSTGVVTWNLDGLAAGATRTITVTMRIDDITKRPWRNFAEITSDSADDYDSTGYESPTAGDVEDLDSTPTPSTTDDVVVDQSTLPTTGFNDPTVDEDDSDVALVDTLVVYDLALIKTVASPTVTPDGTITYTITLANQGNVPSGAVTITDRLAAGTRATSASDGGDIATAGVVTWQIADLAPGASISVTVTAVITDLKLRPFRNTAEITADSAVTYNSETVVVSDVDSVPGDQATSADDSLVIGDAGAGTDAGFDDEDIAVVNPTIVYDLALAKLVPAGQTYRLNSDVRFSIVVKNQGNVPSGPFTVTDVLPVGLTFVSAGNGGRNIGSAVFWDVADLAPGAIVTLDLVVRLTDVSQTSYVNVAEITSDGSSTYNATDPTAPGATVTDKDSTPDDNPRNDPTIDNDNVDLDSLTGDEDDSDIGTLDPAKVALDNRATPPGRLPATGGEIALTLMLAGILLAAGVFLVGGRRRRAAPASAD